MPWPSLMSWSALTLSGVRCKLHKQSRFTFFKIQSEIHDGIGRSSRSSTWKHRVLFEVQPWHSQSSKRTYVILSIDILWCPDRQRPSDTITLDLLQSQSVIAAESYQRNQAQRKILQRSSMRAPCDFFEMFWPSLISWSALTLSGVRCNLLKQSRLTFFKSQSEVHDGIGRSSRSPVWKHRVAFSRFTLDRHRGQYSACQLLPSTLTFTDVLIGIDLVWGSRLTLSKVSRKSMTESGGLPEVQLESTVSFSRFSPDILRAQNGLMLSLALMFSDVLIGKDLLKQSLLTFFRVNRESRWNRTNEIRRSERSCRGQAWKHRAAFSRCLDLLWCLDRHWLCQG